MGVGPARWMSFQVVVPLAAFLTVGCVQTVDDGAHHDVMHETIVIVIETAVHQAVEATLAAQGGIPATEEASLAPATPTPPSATPVCQLWLTAEVDTPLREGPGLGYQEVGRMFAGQGAQAIGRDAFYTWWVININGRDVWIYGKVVILSDCANYPTFVTPGQT